MSGRKKSMGKGKALASTSTPRSKQTKNTSGGKIHISPERDENGKKIKRSAWTDREDYCLLNVIHEIILENFFDGPKQFGPTHWAMVVEKHNRDLGEDFFDDELTIKTRLNVLRANFGHLRRLRDKSGWGWDNEKDTVVAPSAEAWAAVIKADPQYAKVKNKSFPHFDLCEFIYGKDLANLKSIKDTGAREEGCGSSSSDGNDVVEVVPLTASAGRSSSGKKRSRRQMSGEEVSMVAVQRDRNQIFSSLLSGDRVDQEICACIEKINATSGLTDDEQVHGMRLAKSKDNRSIIRHMSEKHLVMYLRQETMVYMRQLQGGGTTLTQNNVNLISPLRPVRVRSQTPHPEFAPRNLARDFTTTIDSTGDRESPLQHYTHSQDHTPVQDHIPSQGYIPTGQGQGHGRWIDQTYHHDSATQMSNMPHRPTPAHVGPSFRLFLDEMDDQGYGHGGGPSSDGQSQGGYTKPHGYPDYRNAGGATGDGLNQEGFGQPHGHPGQSQGLPGYFFDGTRWIRRD